MGLMEIIITTVYAKDKTVVLRLKLSWDVEEDL